MVIPKGGTLLVVLPLELFENGVALAAKSRLAFG